VSSGRLLSRAEVKRILVENQTLGARNSDSNTIIEMRTKIMKNLSTGRLLSRAEVARVLKVSPNTITRWAREGKLRCVRTLGGRRRYEEEEIEKVEVELGLKKARK